MMADGTFFSNKALYANLVKLGLASCSVQHHKRQKRMFYGIAVDWGARHVVMGR